MQPLSVKQAAAQIGLSESAVRDLCNSGQLRHRRVGANRGRIRIDQEDVDAYLEQTVVLTMHVAEKPRKSRAGQSLDYLRARGWKG